MHEQEDGEYLESMRDCGDIALFWEGYEAGNGWNLFDGPGHVLAWLTWLVNDHHSGEFSDTEATKFRSQLGALERILHADDDPERFVSEANSVLKEIDRWECGGRNHGGQRFYTFRGLVSDPDFVQEFEEHLSDEGLPQCEPEDNLAEFERMLSRYPGPGYWTP